MIVGETVRLSATITPSNATDKDVIWASSKQSVATVDKAGLVTAIAEGTSNITASAGGKVGTCVVTVSKRVIAVSFIELNKTELALVEEEEFTLVATVKPDDATDKTVSWSSSDPSVATVAEGKVKALKEGTATITAKAGDKSSACLVTIAKKVIAVESISLNKETLSLTKGQSETLIATVKPDDATDKTVTWTTSNSNTVSVDNGKVTAVGGGKATITAKAGEVEATCEVTVTVPVSSVTLDKNTLSLVEGEESTLNATVKPDDATDKTVIWTSTNSTIATVENGKVKALKEGSVTITAKAGDKSSTCAVSVSKKVIPVSSVSLDRYSVSLEEGQTTKLIATVSPADATDKSVKWESSNTGVATVSQDGTVKAIKEGEAKITASAGEKAATCTVSVSKKVIPVTSVTLNKSSLNLTKGQTEKLIATVNPSNATDKEVSWSTSNNTIVSIQQDGTITAIKSGSATITAKAGEQSATCSVTVSTPVESVSLDRTSVSLEEGQTTTLVATISPNDADDKTVSWSSSNSAIATVDNSGLVKAIGEGEAKITASVGGKSAYCAVSVSKKIIPVTSIYLSESSISLIKGESKKLIATISPSNTTETVAWTSSNTKIATVDQSGNVTAIAGGDATITATAGDKSAKCSVSVTVPVSGISLNMESAAMSINETIELIATVTPSDATDKTVTWLSSDTRIATVNNGVVTAKAAGSATITVTSNDGEKKAKCSVSVNSAYSTDGNENGYDYVDLGLPSGLKWATCNVGASKPEDYGNHYAWGETETKSNYNWIYQWSTYIWCNGSLETLTKYCNNSSYGYNGFIDNKTFLDPEDDAAHVNWGGKWRMPTDGDWTELLNNCAWIWTQQNNVYGYKVVSKIAGYRDKSIFLPAAGISNNASKTGYYWSFNLSMSRPYRPYYAHCFRFDSDNNKFVKSDQMRYHGMSVRPVIGPIPVESISLDYGSISMKESNIFRLHATVYPSTASNTITWTSSNTSVASVSDGLITALKAGTTTITAKCESFTAQCEVTVIGDFVDLGLSVKWATCNLGAYWPWIYGNYYAWGEISTKSQYDRTTYKWDSGGRWADYGSLTRYCPLDKRGYWGGSGEVDGKTCFKDYDYADDAARQNLGGTWRIPTEAEWRELVANCKLSYSQQNGVYGLLVTSRKPGYTNKSIFFPFSNAGIANGSVYGGYYWSSSLYLADPIEAYSACMGSGIEGSGSINVTFEYRTRGLVVRPVCD